MAAAVVVPLRQRAVVVLTIGANAQALVVKRDEGVRNSGDGGDMHEDVRMVVLRRS